MKFLPTCPLPLANSFKSSRRGVSIAPAHRNRFLHFWRFSSPFFAVNDAGNLAVFALDLRDVTVGPNFGAVL